MGSSSTTQTATSGPLPLEPSSFAASLPDLTPSGNIESSLSAIAEITSIEHYLQIGGNIFTYLLTVTFDREHMEWLDDWYPPGCRPLAALDIKHIEMMKQHPSYPNRMFTIGSPFKYGKCMAVCDQCVRVAKLMTSIFLHEFNMCLQCQMIMKELGNVSSNHSFSDAFFMKYRESVISTDAERNRCLELLIKDEFKAGRMKAITFAEYGKHVTQKIGPPDPLYYHPNQKMLQEKLQNLVVESVANVPVVRKAKKRTNFNTLTRYSPYQPIVDTVHVDDSKQLPAILRPKKKPGITIRKVKKLVVTDDGRLECKEVLSIPTEDDGWMGSYSIYGQCMNCGSGDHSYDQCIQVTKGKDFPSAISSSDCGHMVCSKSVTCIEPKIMLIQRNRVSYSSAGEKEISTPIFNPEPIEITANQEGMNQYCPFCKDNVFNCEHMVNCYINCSILMAFRALRAKKAMIINWPMQIS